jgi:hypothetical protein
MHPTLTALLTAIKTHGPSVILDILEVSTAVGDPMAAWIDADCPGIESANPTPATVAAPALHVWTNGPDHIIASSAEDAFTLRSAESNGLSEWTEEDDGPMEWSQVPDHREIEVGGTGGGPTGRLRADQWARALGRGILCSEEWA